MNIFERQVGGRRYRIASQSLWDPAKQRPFARQAVLGSADPAPVADLAATCTVGTRLVGDMGALVWVAEQLDLIKLIDQACGLKAPRGGPTVGEMVLAVAVQRAVRQQPSAILLPFWTPVFRAYRACQARPLPGSRFTAWPPRSPISTWRKPRSRSPARSFGASSCRPTCWRSTPPTLTRLSPPPHPGSWRAAATPRASERICGWSDWRLWSVRRDM